MPIMLHGLDSRMLAFSTGKKAKMVRMARRRVTFRIKRPPATSLACWVVSVSALKLSLRMTRDLWL